MCIPPYMVVPTSLLVKQLLPILNECSLLFTNIGFYVYFLILMNDMSFHQVAASFVMGKCTPLSFIIFIMSAHSQLFFKIE